MTPAQRYSLLQALLLRAQALGSATQAQLDGLLDEMDRVWDAMSEADQRAADARAAELARVPAPDDLRLDDVSTNAGDHDLPRRERAA